MLGLFWRPVDLIRLNESISYPELCSACLGWADSTADGGREEVERMNVNENRKRGLHRLSAVILINTSNEIYQSISFFFLHSASLMLLLVSISRSLSISLSLFPCLLPSGCWGDWQQHCEVSGISIKGCNSRVNRNQQAPMALDTQKSVCHGENITGTKVWEWLIDHRCLFLCFSIPTLAAEQPIYIAQSALLLLRRRRLMGLFS